MCWLVVVLVLPVLGGAWRDGGRTAKRRSADDFLCDLEQRPFSKPGLFPDRRMVIGPAERYAL